MSSFKVDTAADVVDPDDSKLSLREAVARANATAAADTIVFAGALDGKTLDASPRRAKRNQGSDDRRRRRDHDRRQ